MTRRTPWLLLLALVPFAPGSAALPTPDFVVDTESGGSAFTEAQCFQGTVEGEPGGTPITLADALADDGLLSLREAICLANHEATPQVIELPAAGVITLDAVDNTWYGPNGLPAIHADITLEGRGATIERSPSAVPFRFFYVAGPFHHLPLGTDGPGCSGGTTGSSACATPGALTLRDLTLKGGVATGGSSAYGGGGAGLGGAIFNQGTLVLDGVIATGNAARGGGATGGGTGGGGMGADAAGNVGGGFFPTFGSRGEVGGIGGLGGGDAGGAPGAAGVGGVSAFGAWGDPATSASPGQAGAVGGHGGLGGSGGHGGGFAGPDGGGSGGAAGEGTAAYGATSRPGGGGGGGGGGGAFGGGGGACSNGGPGARSPGSAGGTGGAGGAGGGGVGGGGGSGSAFCKANGGGDYIPVSGPGSGGQGGFGGGGGAGAPGAGINPAGSCPTSSCARAGAPGGAGGFGGGGGGGGYGEDAAGGGPGGSGGFGGGTGGNGLARCPEGSCRWGHGGGGAGLGGALFNHGGTVRVVNSLLTGNQATGGAGEATSAGVNSNASQGGQGLGGAIFNLNGQVTLLQSTLAGNTVTGGLGGDAGDVAAFAAGGGVYNRFEPYGVGNDVLGATSGSTWVRLENTVIAGTVGGTDCANDATIALHGANVVQSGNCGGSAVAPLFVDAAGGDFRPGPGSPLIDAGSDALAAELGMDLDGLPRIIDGSGDGTAQVDVGAHELLPSGLVALYPPSPDTVEAGDAWADPGGVAWDSVIGPVEVTSPDVVDTTAPQTATVHYDYTDSGTSAAFPQVTRTVHVVDTTPPVIVLEGPDPMAWPATVAFVDPGAVASDFVDGDVDLEGEGTVDVQTAGAYPLVYAYTDEAGNTALPKTRTVNVAIDDAAPVVTAPDAVQAEATGPTTGVALGTAVATDAFDGDLAATPDAAGPFPVGLTTVTWSATDRSGNTGTASQAVTVVDSTPPQVGTPTDVGVEATGPTTPVTLTAPSATDLVDGGLTATPDVSGPFPVGVTVVTWSATDAAGNVGTASQAVTVTDSTPPTVALVGDARIRLEPEASYAEPGATASDLVDGDLTDAIVVTGRVGAEAGSYELVYTATDAAGNAASATRTVIVGGSGGCGCQTGRGGAGGLFTLLAAALLLRLGGVFGARGGRADWTPVELGRSNSRTSG